MKKIHKFTSDEKIQWWGYGEWVEEPDEVTFTYNRFKCEVLRIACPERYSPQFHMFGGHLCGYVILPIELPLDYGDLSCHGGITYDEVKDGKRKIGFDCAHSDDYLPSTEYLIKTLPELIEIQKELDEMKKNFNNEDSPIFLRSYKNIVYCIQECKSIVDQIILNEKINSVATQKNLDSSQDSP